MNDISFSEDDFYIIFFVLGTILILVSVLWFIILDLQARRNRKMRITSRSLLSPLPKACVSHSPGKGAEPGAARQEAANVETRQRGVFSPKFYVAVFTPGKGHSAKK
jgi:hypothetical protein